MKQTCFLIHGSYGNPYKNFFPYLFRKITKKGYYVIALQFPIYDNQNYNNWSNILSQYLKCNLLNKNSIIITHSLGSIFIVKFLKEHNLKIAKLITVAGFNNISYKDRELYDSFYLENSQNLEIANESICLCSTNDPYIPLEKAKEFAKLINGKVKEYEDAGHFTTNDGFLEFKDIIDLM